MSYPFNSELIQFIFDTMQQETKNFHIEHYEIKVVFREGCVYAVDFKWDMGDHFRNASLYGEYVCGKKELIKKFIIDMLED